MIDGATTSSFGSGFSDNKQDSVTAGFSVGNICGEGASCVVYRMRLGGLRVAVKRLREEYRTNPTYVASYRKEFQIGQQLKHDALPVYRDFRDGHDEVYIVMDYVDGVSLEDFIATREGQTYFRSADNARRLLTQLLDVVGYLHRSGVVHCDIKPANIMLRHSDRGVMLLDLDKAYSDTLDQTHGGTIAFSEPLSTGKIPTAQKDIRAIGTIIETLSNQTGAFSSKRINKLRRACETEGVTIDNLTEILNAPSRSKWPIFAGAIAIVLIVIGTLVFNNRKGSEPTIPIQDTIVIKEPINQEIPEKEIKPAPKEPKIDIDFDDKMAPFIEQAKEAMTVLNDSTTSDRQILDLLYELTERYTTDYGKIVNEYKSKYSILPAIEVELAVAAASEKSHATQQFQAFTKAASQRVKEENGEKD